MVSPEIMECGALQPALTMEVAAWEHDLLLLVRQARGLDPDTYTALMALRPRCRDAIALMVRGASDQEIARELGISYRRARNLAHEAMEGLGVTNRTALCALCHGTQPYAGARVA